VKAFSVTDIPLWGRSLVDASAGTGKTYAIATLFIRLLLETEHPPRQLLVVTFTEAATAELKERIRARLRQCVVTASGSSGASDPDAAIATILARAGDRARVKRRLEQALYEFDDVEISTIHGFCQRALMERALGSDITYGSELYGDARPLIDEIVMDFWARRVAPAQPELLAYMRSDGNKFSLEMGRRLAYSVQRAPQVQILPRDLEAARPLDFTRFRAEFARVRELWKRHDVVRLIESSSVRKQAYNKRYTPLWVGEVSQFFAAELGLFSPLPKCFERFCTARLRDAGGQSLAEHELFRACDALEEEYRQLSAALRTELLRLELQLIDYVRSELPRRGAEQRQLSFDDLLSKLHAALEGPSGSELARALRERYPVALIDEFQDTDPVQLGIFERIYAAPNTSLFLIGDPKQAIYSFRGADVFSYVRAARSTDPQRHYTMTTNYRSDPSLVHAVNHLFAGCPHPFLLPDIHFAAVSPRPGAEDVLRRADGSNASGLEILFAEPSTEQALDGEWITRELPALIAREIAATLRDGTSAGTERLRPRDVAVLTRTNDQAFQIQAALRQSGVQSVVLGDKSVYDSVEAWDLERVLGAIVEPTNTRLIRAALTTDLVGVTANELARLDEDDAQWESWLAAFQDFGAIWAHTGFVHMCRELLSRYGLQERLLALGDGERRMTNLLQLIELLHDAGVRGHLGPSGVVQFLLQQRRGDLIGMEAESAQIRLESDADAVKITTMHRSKGLEYPVVYCPYLWHGTLLHRNDEMAPKLHTAEGELVLDLGSAEREKHLDRARWEAFAENLRLAYVALTRARHRCTLVWGRVQKAYVTSPLGYLLHPPPDSVEPPDIATIQAHLQALDDAALLRDLDRHSQSAPIQRRPALGSPGEPLHPEPSGAASLIGPRSVQRAIYDRFRVSSFSALTSHAPTPSGEDLGRDHDARAPLPLPSDVVQGPRLRLTDFPRGAKAGSFFHDVLEHYDFQSPRPGPLGELVAARLADYHYPTGPWREPVCEHLYSVLDTPLTAAPGTSSLRLADIPQSSRLAELEFCVPVGGRTDPRDGRALRAQELARVFREHPSAELPVEYAESVGRLGFVPLRGFLRGYIDLVLVHDERYFLVDYKANHLGDYASDYAPDGLARAMLRGQYFLQYHLYALALHRYLGQRLRGYDFERHFGGVYYLFIKGMGPELGQSGVFYEKPPLTRLLALSRLLEQAT